MLKRESAKRKTGPSCQKMFILQWGSSSNAFIGRFNKQTAWHRQTSSVFERISSKCALDASQVRNVPCHESRGLRCTKWGKHDFYTTSALFTLSLSDDIRTCSWPLPPHPLSSGIRLPHPVYSSTVLPNARKITALGPRDLEQLNRAELRKARNNRKFPLQNGPGHSVGHQRFWRKGRGNDCTKWGKHRHDFYTTWWVQHNFLFIEPVLNISLVQLCINVFCFAWNTNMVHGLQPTLSVKRS